MKEKHAYVALDFEKELRVSESTAGVQYTLPNENDIVLRKEHFVCPELLFKPSLYGYDFAGIDQLFSDSIKTCKFEFWKELYETIILSGGTTMVRGFPERFQKEITQLAPSRMAVRVIAEPDRQFGAWVGGSVLAGHTRFSQMVMLRDEYNDAGAQIVHRKCPQ
jgi:actin-related protein